MGMGWNLIKVTLGFVAGTGLLYAIQDLAVVLISLIQMIFFTLFYTMLDSVRDRIQRSCRTCRFADVFCLNMRSPNVGMECEVVGRCQEWERKRIEE